MDVHNLRLWSLACCLRGFSCRVYLNTDPYTAYTVYKCSGVGPRTSRGWSGPWASVIGALTLGY